MKTKCVANFFISGLFASDNQFPKTLYFGLLGYISAQLNHRFLQYISLNWRKLTKISDDSNNTHFSGKGSFATLILPDTPFHK